MKLPTLEHSKMLGCQDHATPGRPAPRLRVQYGMSIKAPSYWEPFVFVGEGASSRCTGEAYPPPRP